MEEIIENVVDKGLDNISLQLHIFSVGLGIALVILGIILFISGQVSKEKNKYRFDLRCGWDCCCCKWSCPNVLRQYADKLQSQFFPFDLLIDQSDFAAY